MSGFVLGPGEGPAFGFHGSAVVIKASGAQTEGQLITGPPGLDQQVAARGEPVPQL